MDYLCYHHTDMDGKAAGNEVLEFLLRQGISVTKDDFIQRGYDEPYSEDDYNQKIVFIVDLSFTTSSIKKLFDICEGARRVIWIDHHKSSIDCLKDPDIYKKIRSYDNLKYYLNNNACGALLSFLYFHDVFKDISPDDEFGLEECDISYNIENGLPRYNVEGVGEYVANTIEDMAHIRFLHLVDMYDRWEWKKDNTIEAVYLNDGFYNRSNSLFNEFGGRNDLYKLINNGNFLDKLIKEGEFIKTYNDNRYNGILRSKGYECKIGGYNALVLNENGNSFAFGDKIDEYDLVCLWSYNGRTDKFVYSLYSSNPNIDCAAIAQSINKNGGGHKGAAGFSSNELLFRKN